MTAEGVDLAATARRAAAILDTMPVGTFRGRALGRDWLLTRSLHARGASEKLVGRALDGTGYVSLNLYRLATGPRLRPCEMPVARVMAVLNDLTVADAPDRLASGRAAP
ncbi:MAG: hypothetical protein AAF390_17895 [Pseudomonadota bacterium]